MQANLNREINQQKINRYLEETKIYFDCLFKLQSLKPKKYLFNTRNGEVTDLQSEDTSLEIDIKNKIESTKNEIFNT